MRNPYEDDFAHERDSEAESEAEHLSPCSCGDPGCQVDDRDDTNVRVGRRWYTLDCANELPEVAASRYRALLDDTLRGK